MSPPSSRKIEAEHREFLRDLRTSLDSHIVHARSDASLRAIYKLFRTCHASITAFAKLPGSPTEELVEAAAGCVRRSCMLSMIRQVSLTRLELRRMIECVFWDVYFIDHPVEFDYFRHHPERRTSDLDQPIAATASGPIGFFARYAAERMSAEATGIAKDAVSTLRSAYHDLSLDIHAAKGAMSSSLVLAFDRYDNKIGERLRKLHKRVLRSVAILLAANEPRRMNHLSTMERGWFDWLVGTKDAKKIRGSDFGLVR